MIIQKILENVKEVEDFVFKTKDKMEDLKKVEDKIAVLVVEYRSITREDIIKELLEICSGPIALSDKGWSLFKAILRDSKKGDDFNDQVRHIVDSAWLSSKEALFTGLDKNTQNRLLDKEGVGNFSDLVKKIGENSGDPEYKDPEHHLILRFTLLNKMASTSFSILPYSLLNLAWLSEFKEELKRLGKDPLPLNKILENINLDIINCSISTLICLNRDIKLIERGVLD